jgi:hypothetical protein
MKLADLQDSFQKALLTGASEILSEIPDSPKERSTTLFDVYRNGYVLRLIEILEKDYPQLRSLLGLDRFDILARGYIAANPSHVRNARWFGNALPQYLETANGYRRRPVLAEIAAIEAALNDAFDAPDSTTVIAADMGCVPPEDWERLVFQFHPSVRILACRTNAARIWMALTREEDRKPRAKTLKVSETAFVWRQQTSAKLRILSPEEAMACAEAARGVPFVRLCELIAVFDRPDSAAQRAAGYLKGWIETGALQSIRID